MTSPLFIYSSTEIRAVEDLSKNRLEGPRLMERAGRAAAEMARALLGDSGSVLIVAGPGNNGGDALVAARILKQWWFRVDLVFAGDAERLPPDAAQAKADWNAAGGTCLDDIPDHGRWGLIIDGLFGIGLTRGLEPPFSALVTKINRLAIPCLSLDIPSGLNADSGQPLGPTVRADHTMTFIALKPGLLTGDGPDFCGQLHLRTLDFSAPTFYPPTGWLLDQNLVNGLIPERKQNSHKGTFGKVGILGGAQSMLGAPLLAGRAALKLGAGRVYVGLLAEHAPMVDMRQPELMLRQPMHLIETHLDCLVAGPGMGLSASAAEWLEQAVRSNAPLVLDADALNMIGTSKTLQEQVTLRRAPTIMTPHPAEAARLLGASTSDVLYQRVEIASMLAARFNAFVALKGVGTICAMPNGTYFINSSGNPGLASAGTGDALSGFIGALVAQGLHPRDAVLLGVYLHGAAADSLVAKGIGPIGLTASELIEEARNTLNRWNQ